MKLEDSSVFKKIGAKWNETDFSTLLRLKGQYLKKFFEEIFAHKDFLNKRIEQFVQFSNALHKRFKEVWLRDTIAQCVRAFPYAEKGAKTIKKIYKEIWKYTSQFTDDEQERNSSQTRENMKKYLFIKAINELR